VLAVAEVSGRVEDREDHSQSRRGKVSIFSFVCISLTTWWSCCSSCWSKYHQSLLNENSLNSKQYLVLVVIVVVVVVIVGAAGKQGTSSVFLSLTSAIVGPVRLSGHRQTSRVFNCI